MPEGRPNALRASFGGFRAYKGVRYLGIFDTLEQAAVAVAKAGGDPVRDRSKREPAEDFIAKAQVYLDWVVHTGFEPGDTTAAKELRTGMPHLVRAAPATYMLALEGKEAPWSRLLARAFDAVSAKDKITLLQLTSDVKSEFMEAAAIQHRIYPEGARALAASPRPLVIGPREHHHHNYDHRRQIK